MSKLLFGIVLACTLLLFVGCREDALISRTDISFLQQEILVSTWNDEDHFIQHTEQLDTLYVNQGETVVFTASYALNGNAISADSAINLYNSHYWELDGETLNAFSFEHHFDSTGYRIGILSTIDYTGDTLRDTIHIFVGTPLSITLVTPPRDAGIEPLSEDYIELNWDVSGIDPWEESYCAVYAAVTENVSYSGQTKWLDFLDSLDDLASNDCKSGMRLKGPLISAQWLKKNNLDLKDTSLVIFWGVKAYAYTDFGFREQATDVSSFSTRFLERKSSVIQVKPIYSNLTPGTKISTKIVLINAMGDTIKTVSYNEVDELLGINVQPQSGLHIYANETRLTDYEATPIVIDVSERSMIRLADSIVFTDKIPPKASPIKTSLALTDSVKFLFMDNGAGINPTQKIFVIADYDTVNATYESSILSFANPCRRECEIRIPIPDNARNHNSELFWKIEPGRDSLRITGPFAQWEKQQ